MKAGILGGTFDPVHRGHSYIAGEILSRLNLDQIYFMVSYRPPHKHRSAVSGPYQRFAMVELEILGQPRFIASDWELRRESPSYTIETLEAWTSCHPDTAFCFIAGSDSLKEIHLWRDCDRLFASHCLIFVQRPGAEVDLDQLEISSRAKKFIRPVSSFARFHLEPGRSYLFSLDAPPVSSTEIRRRIRRGETLPEGWLSPQVQQYIQKYRLYEKKP